jgi:hypothetical protein
MNPTKIFGTLSVAFFDITTSFEVGLFDPTVAMIKSGLLPKSAVNYNPSTLALEVPIPSDLFDGISDGNYIVGIRAINAGGPGTWGYSNGVSIIGEPGPVTNITLA